MQIPTLEGETWKPDALTGMRGYWVSSLGRVWREETITKTIRSGRPFANRKPAKLITQSVDRAGYHSILATDQGKKKRILIHRMVCAAFNGMPPEGLNYAAHKDGTRNNNVPDNIRWTTQKDNMADKKTHGTHQCGVKHGMAKVTEDQVREIRRRCANGESQRIVGLDYGLTQTGVSRIVLRDKWQHI